MGVSDYRQQLVADLEQAAQRRTRFRDLLADPEAAGKLGTEIAPSDLAADDEDVAAAAAVMRDKGRDARLRSAALQVISRGVSGRPELIDGLLDLLRDASEPVELRLNALAILQQSSFQVAQFAPKRPAFLDTLRSVVDDPHPDVRRRVIGVLAREKDEYVQRRLLEGLEHPSRALVRPAKAIQFLGYDVHAAYFPLLRRIVANPPTRAAKREAVRLLAADPEAKELLIALLRDKNESLDVRTVSAVALQSLDPQRFEGEARRIVLDDDEDDQLRATCITALAHFANAADLNRDSEMARHVEQLGQEAASPQMKQATRSYMARRDA